MRISEKTPEDIAREEQQKKVQEARDYLKKNNPSDVNSISALRERVKKLEILLGIYEWME